MKVMMEALLKDESGQDLIEYALVAACVGLGCVAALSNLAGYISSSFTDVGSSMTSAI